MKRILLATILILFLAGCGQAARESGFYKHDSMYQDWSHLWFSWTGHKDPTPKDARLSEARGWWGIEKPVDASG